MQRDISAKPSLALIYHMLLHETHVCSSLSFSVNEIKTPEALVPGRLYSIAWLVTHSCTSCPIKHLT